MIVAFWLFKIERLLEIHIEIFTDEMIAEIYFRIFQRWEEGGDRVQIKPD